MDETGDGAFSEPLSFECAPGVDREEVDKRSVYVGQVDYGATPEELQEHFKTCGWVRERSSSLR